MAYDSLCSKYAYLTRIQLVERLDEIIDVHDQILFIKSREEVTAFSDSSTLKLLQGITICPSLLYSRIMRCVD